MDQIAHTVRYELGRRIPDVAVRLPFAAKTAWLQWSQAEADLKFASEKYSFMCDMGHASYYPDEARDLREKRDKLQSTANEISHDFAKKYGIKPGDIYKFS